MELDALDLQTLRLLDLIEAEGSIGKAAALLGITQQAASARLRQFERQLDVRLVVRSPTGAVLSSEGQLVVEWCAPLLSAAKHLHHSLQTLRPSTTLTARLGASFTIAEYLLPQWLTQQVALPVSLKVMNSAAVHDAIRSRRIEVGFVEDGTRPKGLRSKVVGHDHLVLVARAGHRLASRKTPLTLLQLSRLELITREEGSGTRRFLESMLESSMLNRNNVFEMSSTSAIKTAVANSDRLAVLSALAVADEVHARRLVEIAVAGLDERRALRAVWLPEQESLAQSLLSGRGKLSFG